MERLIQFDQGSQVDGTSVSFNLPCGCTFSFRTPSRKTLQQGLLLDPHPAAKAMPTANPSCILSTSEQLRDFHPPWIEIKLSRPFSAIRLFYLVLTLTVICSLVSFLTQSFATLFAGLCMVFLGMFYWLKGVLIESSLLVCSEFGIQTRHQFLTGHRSASSFVPLNRLQGLHLVEQLTPVTIRCYVAAELLQPDLSDHVTTDVLHKDSLLHEGRVLLPLMPGCLTANGLNFLNRLCIPFPTLVFVLRLVHAVCYGPSLGHKSSPCEQAPDDDNHDRVAPL